MAIFEADEKLRHWVGSKFDVAYDSPEKLQKGEVTDLPCNAGTSSVYSDELIRSLLAAWGGYVLEGRFDIPTDKTLNTVFPDVQPLKVKDVLGMWRGL